MGVNLREKFRVRFGRTLPVEEFTNP